MAKSAEEIGLYSDLPPDATVDGLVEDPANPGWAEVSFSDGRVATLPTETARAMPQTAPAGAAPVYGTPGDFGPPAPVVPPQEPMLPEELAVSGATPAPAAPGGVPFLGMGAMGASPLGGIIGAGANPDPVVPVGGKSELPAARVDPMAEIVSPGSAGGMAPFSEGRSSASSETQYAEDPSVAQERVDEAVVQQATAERTFDVEARRARLAGLDAEDEGLASREAEVRRQLRQAELERQGHARVIQAMEKTPIDEDDFWSGSPGRAAGAWIALALSGFLQGVTRGQNPALNQMVQALNHAQDRYVQTQRANRDSVLRGREKLMGDAKQAEDSFRMQLNGIVSKRIDIDAQRAGTPAPPGLETYKAKLAMDAAERQNQIGARIVGQAQQQSTAEQRATPATGPVRRGDQVLQHLGVAPKAHADAMDPKGLNLGGVVGGAERLNVVGQALEKIAARNGGSLPSQETVSWSTLGLAPQAARWGLSGGKDEVSVKQLLEEAKLAYKQTVNIKSIDSENEGKNFNAIMDSGEGQSTIEAVRTRAKIANENAIGVASGVSRDAQGYIDFVRGSLHNNPGVEKGARPASFRPVGAGPTPGQQAQETAGGGAGGGPAPSAPLAPNAAGAALSRPQQTPESPSVTASETTPTSPRGTYIRLKDRPRIGPR